MSDICCLWNVPGADRILTRMLAHHRTRVASDFQVEQYVDNAFPLGLGWVGLPTNHTGLSRETEPVVAVGGEVFLSDQRLQRSGAGGSPQQVGTLYKKRDLDFLPEIKGWFNLLLWDKTQRRLVVANDRYGIKPFYYTRLGEGWIFASRLQMLLTIREIRREWCSETLVETAFLNYPLGDKTWLKGVHRLPPAACWELLPGRIQRRQYWFVETLLEAPPLPLREALEESSNRFRQVVAELTQDVPAVLQTLTGGFDGRTILAALDRERLQVHAYTFGLKDCLNATIARRVAEVAGCHYEQVELEEDFRRNFWHYAERTIQLTDGLATFLRSHYLYAFERQRKYSPFLLTGIGGSELLRPVHNTGDMYHPNLKRLMLADQPERVLAELIETKSGIGFFSRELWCENRVALQESVQEHLLARYNSGSQAQKMLLFNLVEVFPKYFGAEVVLESSQGVVRLPYLDSDFITLIVRAPFAAGYGPLFKDSPVSRRKGQLFYSYVIRRYAPALGKIATDRGYPPEYNLHPLGYLLIAPTYLYTRASRCLFPGKYRGDFDMVGWTRDLITQVLLDLEAVHSGLFDVPRIEHALQHGSLEQPGCLRELAQAASFEMWWRYARSAPD